MLHATAFYPDAKEIDQTGYLRERLNHELDLYFIALILTVFFSSLAFTE